jgi:glucose/mannose-6-phosphate isomerase
MIKNDYEDEYIKILDSIKGYPDQLVQAWNEVHALEIPEDYKKVSNIVFCGMGGSALGARMVDSFTTEKRLRIPFEIFTEFHIPEYTNQDSLVVISSYSGNTEETIHCLHEAILKKSKIFCITTGGKLAELMSKEGLPGYVFNPVHNISNQPRMATCYASGAVLGLLSVLGLAHVTYDEIEEAVETMEAAILELDENVAKHKNVANLLMEKVRNKLPVIVASEHLVGTAHALKNSFNENAKTFAVLFDLPELNHHLMEGLANPKLLKNEMHFVFITSELYSERIQIRYPLTFRVVEDNGIEFSVYNVQSRTKLSQVYELLIFGSFLIYYLTRDLKLDPVAIPWVDFFKRELKK